MSREVLELHGYTVTPFIQLYNFVDFPDRKHGELLSRIDGDRTPGEMLRKLSAKEHLNLIAWQVEVAKDLAITQQITCSINVENNVLVDPSDRGQFIEIASEAPESTTFEFTESHKMQPPNIANPMFAQIRAKGCTTALDDFGTGLNGMSLLTEYDFDIVKIDKSLIHDIDTRPEKLKVISLLNEMLETLNRSHVVEGVERSEIFDLLVKAQFKVFQGFLFHMPVPIPKPDELSKITTR